MTEFNPDDTPEIPDFETVADILGLMGEQRGDDSDTFSQQEAPSPLNEETLTKDASVGLLTRMIFAGVEEARPIYFEFKSAEELGIDEGDNLGHLVLRYAMQMEESANSEDQEQLAMYSVWRDLAEGVYAVAEVQAIAALNPGNTAAIGDLVQTAEEILYDLVLPDGAEEILVKTLDEIATINAEES